MPTYSVIFIQTEWRDAEIEADTAARAHQLAIARQAEPSVFVMAEDVMVVAVVEVEG